MMTLPLTSADYVESPNRRDIGSQVLWAEASIDEASFVSLRRKILLEGCKWDSQVGDVNTLAPFPLVMKSSTWKYLASQAEQLSIETISAEAEILQRPELINRLGLPLGLRQILADKTHATPSAGRVMRFDFHFTTQGWRISEVNSDVPGGFTESSYFTELMAEHFPSLRPAGNPAALWSRALAEVAGQGGVIALLSAPGYMEDHQVIAFLAAQLREQGCCAQLAKPEQIIWRDGIAHLETTWHRGPLDVIVKFYQAEWLSRLPEKSGWKCFFRGGKTPVANPACAIISESKRFPLVWDMISTPMPTWRELLPETVDPRNAPWWLDDGWLLKTAMCNTGDTVSIRELMRLGQWLKTRLSARLTPNQWIAQRRFESVPVNTPAGPRHVCVGVYVINGRAGGAYVRMSEKPVIDFAATDVALLLEDDE